ncbi:unnamed protein product [Durusdinium trenchii]|uniref:Uncharacterized protein n=1 Tax=Durusdinium trenchii TaxID=1381693 RepID=A0ABP0S053_9DINO
MLDVGCLSGSRLPGAATAVERVELQPWQLQRCRFRSKRMASSRPLVMTLALTHRSRIWRLRPAAAAMSVSKQEDGFQPTLGDDTGLDPSIKDLEVETMYATLLARTGGPYELKQWFTEAGFLLSFPLSPKNQTTAEETLLSEQQRKENLVALSQRFREIGVITGSYELLDIEANLEKWECCVCLLRYQDRWGNRYWRNKWAKQARGTVLFINPEDQSDVRCISYKLERGAEVSTRQHREEGIDETQDLKEGRVAIFDDDTIHTCVTLAKGGAITGHLSSKGDGSYFGVTLACGLKGQIWDAITDGFGSDWVKLWKKKGKEYGALHGVDDLMMVPATQGGLMMGDHMQGYMTTALLAGNHLATREELMLYDSCVAAMEQYGALIFDKLARIAAEQLGKDGCKVVSFENMCKNRRGLLGDREHTELACRYERDRCILLGLSDCESKRYTPHSAFNTHGFEEPMYWIITHSDQLNSMIGKLDDLVWGSITEAEFLTMYPPANLDKIGTDPIIDYEGFAFLEMKTIPDSVVYMYRKIKSVAYYKSHKLQVENIPYLLQLGAKAGHIFPLAQHVLDLLSPGVFQQKMERVLAQVVTLLDFADPANTLLSRIRMGHALTVAKAKRKKMPKDPLAGFDQRPFDVQCRIVINSPFVNFSREAEFASIDIDMEDADLIYALKSIVMAVKPWIPRGQEGSFTDEISTEHPVFQPLVSACLGTVVAK